MTVDIEDFMLQVGLPADNLATRQAAMTPGVRALHRRVLGQFADSGGPPSADQLTGWAAELDLELKPALAQLAGDELVFLDPTGDRVVGGVPFAAGDSAHQVRIAGGSTVATNCAVDALGISAMVGRDTDVRSTDLRSGAPVTAMSRNGQWICEPAEAVVFLGSAGTSRLTDTCCPVINFFTDPGNAAVYQAEHGLDGTVLSVTGAARVGALVFGDLLDDRAATKPTPRATVRSPSTEEQS